MSTKDFNENFLSPLLEKISKKNRCYFLMSDFKFTFLKIDSHHSVSKYYNNLCFYHFAP